jgi:hypothetical protein
MASKDELHHLIDKLPEGEVQAAQRFLEHLCDDPLSRMLREAPDDDEPTTAEDDQAAEEGWREYEAGKGRPWEEVRKELGRE